MGACVSVCDLCVQVCAHVHAGVCACVCACMCACVCACVHVPLCVCMCVCTGMCVYAPVHLPVRVCARMCVHARVWGCAFYLILSFLTFRISHPPQTLEELGVSLQLMDTLQHDLPNLETQIPPIHEQFTILEKYEVPVPDTVSSRGVWSTPVSSIKQW
jgi:hypothetical protein